MTALLPALAESEARARRPMRVSAGSCPPARAGAVRRRPRRHSGSGVDAGMPGGGTPAASVKAMQTQTYEVPRRLTHPLVLAAVADLPPGQREVLRRSVEDDSRRSPPPAGSP